ncbi:hypothetical protein CRENBAI_014422 [Crenichthys baileyi]|uniref:Uncharacterized protein n=1 Tax=Crenichthys baileyi TaxID=28760 RepID=A0AAV9RDG1_9TELE
MLRFMLLKCNSKAAQTKPRTQSPKWQRASANPRQQDHPAPSREDSSESPQHANRHQATVAAWTRQYQGREDTYPFHLVSWFLVE